MSAHVTSFFEKLNDKIKFESMNRDKIELNYFKITNNGSIKRQLFLKLAVNCIIFIFQSDDLKITARKFLLANSNDSCCKILYNILNDLIILEERRLNNYRFKRIELNFHDFYYNHFYLDESIKIF